MAPWDVKQQKKNFGYGLRTDVYAIPKKLTFMIQSDYLRAHGTSDFTIYNSALYGAATGNVAGIPLNIPNADSYQKYSFKLTTCTTGLRGSW